MVTTVVTVPPLGVMCCLAMVIDGEGMFVIVRKEQEVASGRSKMFPVQKIGGVALIQKSDAVARRNSDIKT